MDRLTESARYPLRDDTFCFCQLCGRAGDDICEYQMWREADEEDRVSPDSPILLTCKGKACGKIIDDHERLYVLIPWSRGGPGKFILLCGDCTYREGSRCTHPHLKENGGNGLLVTLYPTLGLNVHVCFHDGRHLGAEHFTPATHCEGHPDPNRQPEELSRRLHKPANQ